MDTVANRCEYFNCLLVDEGMGIMVSNSHMIYDFWLIIDSEFYLDIFKLIK